MLCRVDIAIAYPPTFYDNNYLRANKNGPPRFEGYLKACLNYNKNKLLRNFSVFFDLSFLNIIPVVI